MGGELEILIIDNSFKEFCCQRGQIAGREMCAQDKIFVCLFVVV